MGGTVWVYPAVSDGTHQVANTETLATIILGIQYYLELKRERM